LFRPFQPLLAKQLRRGFMVCTPKAFCRPGPHDLAFMHMLALTVRFAFVLQYVLGPMALGISRPGHLLDAGTIRMTVDYAGTEPAFNASLPVLTQGAVAVPSHLQPPRRALRRETAISSRATLGRDSEDDRSGSSCVAPYSVSKFQKVLWMSRLEGPNATSVVNSYDFAGKCLESFYLATDSFSSYMTFQVSGFGKHSELQQIHTWRTSTQVGERLEGWTKVFVPGDTQLTQFTFAQIHDSDQSTVRPLLQMVWRRQRSGLSDHIWASLRNSLIHNNFDWIDCGPRLEGFWKLKVEVKKSLLQVRVGSLLYVSRNVSYWDSRLNYFQAGVYNQADATAQGASKVQFQTLSYVTNS